jgi:monoamine oxidase
VALCIVGGNFARQLTMAGAAAMVDYAQQQVAALFWQRDSQLLSEQLNFELADDPWTIGSYSNATPGHAAARQQLAAPLGKQVFFAGESLSVEHYATVYGAYLSGIAAADQVLSSFGRQPRSRAA